MNPQTVSNFPAVAAITDSTSPSAELSIAGIRQTITAQSPEQAVADVIKHVQDQAFSLGRPLRLWTLHEGSETVLIIPPQGDPFLEENPPSMNTNPLDDLRARINAA